MSNHQSDDNVFYGVIGGMDRKGRVFGLGLEAMKYKPSSSSISSDDFSLYELKFPILQKEIRIRKTCFLHHKMVVSFVRKWLDLWRVFSLGQTSQSIHYGPKPHVDDQQDEELDDNMDV